VKKVVREEIRTVDKETGEVIVTPAITQEVYPPKKGPFFKTPYNHNTREEAKACATVNNEPSLTEQAPRDQVNINNILAKFGVANVLATRPGQASYLDVPENVNLATAFEQLSAAKDAFERLPKNVKQHFETIENYVAYVDQAVERKDVRQLQQLGLMPKDPPKPKEEPPAPPKPQGTDPGTAPTAKGAPNAPVT